MSEPTPRRIELSRLRAWFSFGAWRAWRDHRRATKLVLRQLPELYGMAIESKAKVTQVISALAGHQDVLASNGDWLLDLLARSMAVEEEMSYRQRAVNARLTKRYERILGKLKEQRAAQKAETGNDVKRLPWGTCYFWDEGAGLPEKAPEPNTGDAATAG